MFLTHLGKIIVAMLDEMFCPTCQRTVTVAVICGCMPDECGECKEKREKEDKERTLSALRFLPLEERIAKIEEKLYDLENRPTTYDLMG